MVNRMAFGSEHIKFIKVDRINKSGNSVAFEGYNDEQQV